ncbi:uncharacterized protein LOC129910844 [Episyrphus balteatus]|uniref:uncharacterized protein LOC129910844 n=2 Tax=Episyrphus balteatus TaxID=286459 RepID=UPI00248644B5|nr:uncharacterized protein LOC129910844 [Episyrphus balteatus]XP_055844406.1 uncharacterized protein LOC129910844 [Episyrphus balteatus]XP_055844407.1 uncharacterized protein LOC129910844 [Episyrphus balteatus]
MLKGFDFMWEYWKKCFYQIQSFFIYSIEKEKKINYTLRYDPYSTYQYKNRLSLMSSKPVVKTVSKARNLRRFAFFITKLNFLSSVELLLYERCCTLSFVTSCLATLRKNNTFVVYCVPLYAFEKYKLGIIIKCHRKYDMSIRHSSAFNKDSISLQANNKNISKIIMFKYVALFCIISVANAGILSGSLGTVVSAPTVIAAPRIISAPAVSVLRTAPIATIGAPLGISSGLISNGLISNGLVSGGLISNGLVSGGLVTKGLVSGGLISGGLVSSGKLLI